jgi:hypothetical protein
LASGFALVGCGDAALDALPSAGTATVRSVDAVGRLRLEDGSTVRLAGVEGVDRATLARLVEGRAVDLLRAGEGSARHVRLKRGRVWVQGRLLENGGARARPALAEAALADAMLRREALARRAGRGGWTDRWRVLTAAEAERARGFQIVEGRVQAVSVRRSGVFLDFGANWRTDLSAQVPGDAVEAFERAGEEPSDLQGRLVRLRGELKSTANGTLVRLDGPQSLELLEER